jgi:hypothetical protein
MVDRSDLIAASVYSRKLFRDCSSNSSLRERRGSEVSRLQNESGCPHHSLGLSCVGMRPLLPKTGHGSARPSTKALGPPAVDAPGTTAVDVPGPLGQCGRPPLTDLGNDGRPLLMVDNGEVGDDQGRGRLSHPDIDDNGRLRGRIGDGPGGNRCRRRQQDRQARSRGRVNGLPRHDGRSNRGVNLGGLPQGNPRRLGPPPESALCGGQPSSVARRSTGCRSQLRLKGLRGGQTSRALPSLAERERRQFKTHSEKTKTEVSSDTYPLRGKANRACGEAPWAPVSTDAAEGCPAADFGAASTLGARGAEGATYPGVVTTTEGPASCAAGAGTCSWGGGMRFGLTPRSHPNYLDQGVKYPLGLPPLLGPGPWCPSPKHWWCQPTWGLAWRPLAQPRVQAEAKSGRHVVIFIIIIVVIIIVVRRLRRRLQREPIPCLPPMTLLQGFPSSHPLASPGLFRVLLLLFLLRGESACGSVRRVLQDRWQGELKTPQPLRTNENPNSES